MTRGIRSHSLNIKDCNRIVNPYTFPPFRLGFPFSSRFYIVEILFLSLTNDRAFLLALLRIFKFGTRCSFRLFNKYRVKNYRWNHHFDNIPWIFILFFTFYLFFFPPKFDGGGWTNGEAISKTFIEDKRGSVRDEDFIRGAELFAASRED